MFRQCLKGLLAGSLIAAAALAPVTDASAEGARLNGVLVSPNSAIALIDGGMYREGDAIGDARIVAIAEGSIRLLSESGEFDVRVGSRLGSLGVAKTERTSSMRITLSRSAEERKPVHERRPRLAAADTPGSLHTVKPGETLSGIASRYRETGVTLDQMMAGLFQVNPQAFGGSIHKLYSGAKLRIPAAATLDIDAMAASAEVRRQTLNSENEKTAPTPEQLAAVNEPSVYGPVEAGETLSMIAARVAPSGITGDQMMIAIFESNPDAFGDNINLLYAGATLRIPETAARLPAAAASSEVVRHREAWRRGAADPPGHESTYAGLNGHASIVMRP